MERILTSYKLLPSGDYSHQKTFTCEDKSVMNFIDEESDSSGFVSETDDETVPLLKPNMEPANVLDDGPIEMMDTCPEDMIEKPIIPVHVEQHCDNHCDVASDVMKS